MGPDAGGQMPEASRQPSSPRPMENTDDQASERRVSLPWLDYITGISGKELSEYSGETVGTST